MTLAIEKICLDEIADANVSLSMARLDKSHRLASGNKIYKLAPIIKHVKVNNIKQIVSFGGAFSNHIHALSLMAKQEGIESIGIIRGERDSAQNATLEDAQNAGMKLVFVDRTEYKKRHDDDYLAKVQKQYPNALIVPEGGSHPLAVFACQLIVEDINKIHQTDLFTVACGTGTTAAGMACKLLQGQHLHAYSVLKDASMESRIKELVTTNGKIKADDFTLHQADFGGYAKLDKSLLDFILNWLEQTGILLDPIYTSKMCMKLIEQINSGKCNSGESITMIHSGGLQGWRGMQQRVETLADKDTWKLIEQALIKN